MRWLEDLWWNDERGRAAPVVPVLAAAELLFRAGVAARGALHGAGVLRSTAVPGAVISVGNLVVGGAGKTPAALAIAERLQSRGRHVALLSRGYGARRSDARVVSDGVRVLLSERDAGDEPFLMATRLPAAVVLCGPRRVTIARCALDELGADALVLDDGFQHRALARDLDVVVVDAARPAGNGRLLPRGPNREPWSALARAQLAWIAGAERVSAAELAALCASLREATGAAPVVARHAVRDVVDGTLRRSFGADGLSGRRVWMACAIGRPDRFRHTLSGIGAQLVGVRTWRDHARVDHLELSALLRDARAEGCDAVAITEKDAVRLPSELAEDPLWRVVRIDAEIVQGADALDASIARALAAGDARRLGAGPARVTGGA